MVGNRSVGKWALGRRKWRNRTAERGLLGPIILDQVPGVGYWAAPDADWKIQKIVELRVSPDHGYWAKPSGGIHLIGC